MLITTLNSVMLSAAQIVTLDVYLMHKLNPDTHCLLNIDKQIL